MTKYGKYLRKVQEKYFENIIKTAYPSAKYKVIETYWENDINLPFHIFGEIKIKRKSYNAILEFFRCKVKEYDTNYGILVLALYNQKNNNDNLYVYINPVTLECNICFDGTDKEKEFWKNLAYWAENFESKTYSSPHDGKTSPDLLDVIITHYNNQ